MYANSYSEYGALILLTGINNSVCAAFLNHYDIPRNVLLQDKGVVAGG